MSPKKKKNKLDFGNDRRIVVRAPSVDLKREFDDFAKDIEGRTSSNLAWHLMLGHMRKKKAAIKSAEEERAAA